MQPTITPRRGLRNRRPFDVVVEYSGIPETIVDLFGVSGFVHTDDGALIVGQPHVAATWFPVNDHPSDAASYSIDLRVPAGLEAVANGVLTGTRTRRGWTTWSWYAKEPMASYLVGGAIGELEIDAYRADGIRYWDAIDPDLLTPVAVPVEGTNMLLSGFSEPRYQRLMRTIEVPAGGATLTFWATYDIELDWDFLFVEARTAVPALDDWTTLEAVGVTSPNTGSSCPSWHALHPMVARYQGEDCTQPTWHAVTGRSGWKQWTIDLSPYAGSSVELAISYAGDESVSGLGVAIDDIVVSTGEGTTSFEEDGDTLDGWTIAGPPAGSPDNQSEWFVGSVADLPPPVGAIAQQAFARQPEIVDFLSAYFGRYPWRASGGIVDDAAETTFALENQTRPIYSTVFFNDPIDAELVVVHELAHQWTGDQLRVERWQDIWLNEGFATYMEWLWLEREGLSTTQNVFDDLATFIPADDPWWQITIGDPGPDAMFEFPVYFRGAMTLHALRQQIGDDAFFTLVRRWIRSQAGGTVNTAAFIDLAERVSGQQLDDLFTTWLYTPEKPAGIEPVPVAPPDARVATTSAAAAEAGSRAWIRTAPDVIRALFARHATH